MQFYIKVEIKSWPASCHLSNITRFYGEDINASRLKVVPQVVGGDDQHHLTGVAFLAVQLDKHIGVGTSSRDVARLHGDMIANVCQTNKLKIQG